jgi:hypothetical protein
MSGLTKAWDSLNRGIENVCMIIGVLAQFVGFPFGLWWILTTLTEMGWISQ